MYLNEMIEQRYGKATKGQYCELKKFGEDIYLHKLFTKIDLDNYYEITKDLNAKLLPELVDFYKSYNGCRVFSDSISIYGISSATECPFDLYLNNLNKRAELKHCKHKEDYVFIGGIADMEMYYLMSEFDNPKIHLSKNGETKIYKSFDSLQELLMHYYLLFNTMYDDEGYRLNPNKGDLFEAIPILSNKVIYLEKIEQTK